MFSKKKDKKQPNNVKSDDHKVKDYGNEPFFVQKAASAKKVIEKYGLPKQMQERKK